MGRIVWNDPDDRRMFGGADRGVLYLTDRAGVPWNGISSVVQKSVLDTEALYFDGRRFAIDVVPGAFDGTLTAYNYPPEFERAQGFEEVRPGVYADAQRPITFGLTYRTSVRDAAGQVIGHKIHLFWDLTAIPSDVTHNTLGGTNDMAPFVWDVSATPTELPGILPTAHLIVDTTKIDPWLVEEIENTIYGNPASDAQLPPLTTFYEGLITWARFWVLVDGDDWTGTEARPNTHIFPVDDEDVFLDDVNVTVLDADNFVIEDVYNAQDVANLKIRNNGDETITFSSDDSGTIVDVGGGNVGLNDIELLLDDADTVRINTTDNPR